MRLASSRRAAARLIAFAAICLLGGLSSAEADHRTSDLVTVEDVVRFARIGDPQQILFAQEPAIWSPDDRSVAIVVRSGDPAANLNRAELLLYRREELGRPNPQPERLAAFASGTNDHPLAQVRWLDADTLFFTAVDGSASAQLFKLRVSDRHRTQITSEASSLTYYDVTPSGRYLVAAFDRQLSPPLEAPECIEKGCRVTADTLYAAQFGVADEAPPLMYFDLTSGNKVTLDLTERADPTIVRCRDGRGGGISPDGAYVLRLCHRRPGEVPGWWSDYKGYRDSSFRQWMLVDLRRNKVRRVSEAPFHAINTHALPLWIDGGSRAILPAAFEPLTGVGPEERAVRSTHYAALVFNPQTGVIERIARLDSRCDRVTDARWDEDRQTLSIQAVDADKAPLPLQSFRRVGRRWTEADAAPAKPQRLRLEIAQSLNDRPILVSVDPGSGERHQILDPNPWLAQRRLAKAEPITWKLKNGTVWRGVLYFPVNYKAPRRYPLVVQTHGARMDEFSLSGYSVNFAAQPLAAHGVMVLQADDITAAVGGGFTGTAEYPAVLDGYESAIDHLDERGLIDRSKVGLVGWSRTGPYVGFALTQSSHSFAAAAFTDTADFGWWWYLAVGGLRGEDPYGSAPFGDGFDIWRRTSPTFNLDRVRTPMLMWTAGSAIGVWDWYAGLRRLGKPVEYWVLPDGRHEVFKIGERIRTNQLLVDWFRFWLEDEEDPQADKREQYSRWRHLRAQQDAGVGAGAPLGTD